MKRIVCMLLIATLLLSGLALHVGAGESQESVVRVRLSTGDAESVSVTLSGTYSVDGTTVTGGTVTASIKDGTITLRHSSAGKLKTTTTSARLVRVGTDAETKLTFQNAKHGKRVYYGDFVFYNDGGILRLINYVDMHHYLYGVVSGELSDSSRPDFLKVETIIAKGFALAEIEARASKYFDVYDTTQSQLYYGYVAGDKNTIAAVDEVWTQTLRYNGKTVKTYYSTADGGQIITPRIRWGGTVNAGAYWFGYDPFDLMGSSKNVSFTVRGDAPDKLDDKLSAFLKTKTGADTLISVDALTGIYDPDNPNGTARYPSTLAPQKRWDWTLTVGDGNGGTKQVGFSCTPDEVKAAIAPDATGTVCFAVRTAEKEWKLIWGVSSGHRAGLSHRGAGQMVKQGYSYVDVLKFYYRGATLYDENGKAIESSATFDFTYEDGAEPSPTATPGASPTATPGTSPSPTPSSAPAEYKFDVIVVSSTLNMREGPSTSAATIRELKLGAILRLIESDASGKWDLVYDEESGSTGWVSDSYVAYYEREPQPHREGVCNADDSNLRAGPSTNFAKYSPLNKGDRVYVYYETGSNSGGNWYYIMDRRTGQGAFIWKSYITLGADAPEYLLGDANGDGEVDVTDASLILRFTVKLSPIENERLLAADVQTDGTVNAADAAAILRHIVGLD